MPSNRLTDAVIKRAAATDKPYKLTDGEGLYLYVSTAGGKSWRLQYRRDGKQQTATLGRYPDVTLAQARQKRVDARAVIADGDKPAVRIKTGTTLKQASAAYWGGRHDVSEVYKHNATRALEMYILPTLGSKPVGAVTKADCMDVLGRMNAAGKFVYVRKTRRWLGQVLDWAVESGHAESNVVAEIRPEKAFGKRKQVSYPAIDPSQASDLLARLAMETRTQTIIATELLMLTWVRTGELRGMRWAEIEGDTWRIPEGRMKRRQEHLVPLSRQAQALLKELHDRRLSDDIVFVNARSNDRPMSENAILYMLGRIGYRKIMTGHGFRSLASTWANDRQWSPDAIEMQIAHSKTDAVRAAYNRAAYMPIRREMMQAFADWVQEQRVRADVVSMPSIRGAGG